MAYSATSIWRFAARIRKVLLLWPEVVPVLEVEIIGNGPAIEAAKAAFTSLSQVHVQQYSHRTFAGDAGVFGLIGRILPRSLEALFNLLKSLLVKDRDLKVSFDGSEFVVRDVQELEKLLDMLATRGVVVHKVQGG
jgi:hypothetical protein